MREFLLELYLQYGEREFKCGDMGFELRVHGFLVNAVTTRITPKGMEYLKNLDNPRNILYI